VTETSGGPDGLGDVSLSVLDMLPEGVVVLDADWVYRYVNPAGAAFLGTTVDALLGQDYRELYPEADGTTFQQAYARVMRAQEAETLDEYYPPWDKFFRNTVLPWHGGVAVFFSDVTDERRAQAEQAKELEVLQQVVDHADALIVLKDLDGRYVMVNKAVAEFLGREPEDMIGRQTRDFFPPELADAMEASERKVMTTERARHIEQVVELQPGRPRALWTVRFPAYDADGVLSGVGAIYTDVTQRRETEARLADALREAAETVALLETLQSSSPVGFAFVDRDFRFVRVNDAMAALNGLSIEAHLGNHVRDVVPALWSQIEPVYAQVLETGQSITEFELGGETPARPGEKRDWLVSFYPVRPVGEPEPIGIGVVAHEVTAHRRLEAQLRQAQKMEAVGQLAGGIAHDFNNVLAAVTLTAELCLQQVPDGPVRDGLARILSTAHSASGLTKQLLVFSRQQRVSPVPVDVGAAVEGVREILTRTLGDNIRLAVDLQPLPPVLLDPSQLEQIVLNLAINARDAMPGGGTLTVTTTLVDLAEEDVAGRAAGLRPAGDELRPGRYVELRVGDDGFGMPADVRDRATEPFFTTKAGVGTGLGLATVYGILRSAGGGLTIYSEVDLGTVVRVLLPVAEQDAVRPRPERTERVEGAGQRVMVVEDQADLRDVIVDVLAGAGYQVDSAEAVQLRDSLDDLVPVDLLVTDVVMPGLSGPALAAAVGDTWPGTQVLFISGYTDGMLASHGLTPSTSRLLVKPFTAATLLQAVAEALAMVRPG
jgi:two-component system, cell cycle sensor histidine kinase and response regulator CckA